MFLHVEGEGPDIESPGVEQVESAVRAMDGEKRTQVILYDHPDPEVGLTVGGGGDAGFVVSIQRGNSLRVALTRPPVDGEESVSICSGQRVDFPRSEVVDLALVLRVVHAFLNGSQEAADVLWHDM